VLTSLLLKGCLGGAFRNRVAKGFGAEAAPIACCCSLTTATSAFCVHVWCHQCALCQEARFIERQKKERSGSDVLSGAQVVGGARVGLHR